MAEHMGYAAAGRNGAARAIKTRPNCHAGVARREKIAVARLTIIAVSAVDQGRKTAGAGPESCLMRADR